MDKINHKSAAVAAIAVGLSLAGPAGAATLGGITIDKDGKAMVAGSSVDKALPSEVATTIKNQTLASVDSQPNFNFNCVPPNTTV